MRRSMNEHPIIMDKNPRTPIAESIRSLRTSVEYTMAKQDLKTILITSAKPQEGKTTTAANLAISFAQIDKKVLMIDADLRKPSLHHVFNKANRGGLANVLIGQLSIYDVIRETYIDNLHVITSGPIPTNPSEILASERMNDLLAELKQSYDLIIVDTSPILGLSDGQILSTKCDGVYIVIQFGSTRRSDIKAALSSLEQVQANLLGTILNKAKHKPTDRYAYEYNYYHGNAEQESG